MRIPFLKRLKSPLHNFKNLLPSSTKVEFRHYSSTQKNDGVQSHANLDTGTGDAILGDLLQIWKNGAAPQKFNFSKDIFDRHAIHRPNATALHFDGDHPSQERCWSFSALREESIRSAIFLRNLLEEPSSESSPYILTVLSRLPEWWFLHLAAIRIGSIFSPGTTMLTSEDIYYRLDASRAKIIITDEPNMAKINAAANKLEFGSKLKKVVVRSIGSTSDLPKDWIDYNSLVGGISDEELKSFKHSDTLSDSLAQSYFTSGTTGMPKMVGHTHASYGIGHYTTVKMLDLKETDLHWCISDPGWAKSSYSNFFAPWTAGSTVYIHQMERFEGVKVLETLCKQPITTFCAPPTLYKSMVQEKNPKLFTFPKLRYCVGAGEAVSPEVIRVWQEKTGVLFHQAYGQTEMTAVDCEISCKDDSIGVSSGFMDLRIVGEDGKECLDGTEGQVALKVKPVRPIGLFHGYLRKGPQGPELDAEKNASVFVGDFYLTGDQGFKDSSGHIFLVGRADDIISSSGYRIGPTEIESVLQTHPAVVESAAVASPDLHRGEIVKAFIILTPEYQKLLSDQGSEDRLIKEIQAYVKLHTAPYKFPRKIEFVDSLPKTVSGKILRRELKRIEFEKFKKLSKS